MLLKKLPLTLRKKLRDPIVILIVTLACGFAVRLMEGNIDPNIPFHHMVGFTYRVFFLMSAISVSAIAIEVYRWRQHGKFYWISRSSN